MASTLEKRGKRKVIQENSEKLKKPKSFKYQVDLKDSEPCEKSYWDWLPCLVKRKIYRYVKLMAAWDKHGITLPRCKVHSYVSMNQRSLRKNIQRLFNKGFFFVCFLKMVATQEKCVLGRHLKAQTCQQARVHRDQHYARRRIALYLYTIQTLL